MVSGTFVLTDTIKSAFTTVFTTVYQNTDAVITGKSAISSSNNGNAPTTPSLPASLLTQVRALPSVAEASGGISDTAQLVGRNGKVISSGGAPGLAFSYSPAGQHFNPLTLTSGRFPTSPDEVDIDASTASKHDYKVGDEIGVVARGPVERFRIAGTVQIGGVSSLGGATMAVFTLAKAQQLFDKVGKYDSISVAAKHGYSPAAGREPDQAAARAERAGQDRSAAGPAGDQRHQRLPQHLPGLPARVRRYRAVRRELRDRQHAVDHDRAAHARAGHAAHARRDPASGAALGAASRRS